MTAPPDDLQTLWQTQEPEIPPMTLDDIRKKAAALERLVRRRNLVEHLAAAITIPLFGAYVWFLPGWMLKAGSALVILGIAYMQWQMRRRATAGRAVTEGAAGIVLDSYRHALTRQRDALTSVWRWYILPYVPGLALMLLGSWSEVQGDGLLLARIIIGLAVAVIALILAVIWLANLLAAARLQQRIDELDRLTAG
ncbi:hypothetical protein [Nitrospirillum iridis]|uniref:Transmembrane protein n=1 Tax=Nitrospirillum iridis TaxID=765888 RepID=A0A7X0EHG4_9PROT|nr:hypothetical protein [Nitrospirillum iridis]MBB6255121.1 hypothetical protein [Nitrospirillum iridis]